MEIERMELYWLAKLYDDTGKNARTVTRTLYSFGIRTYDDLRRAAWIEFPKRYGLSIGEKRYAVIRKMREAIQIRV